MMPPLVSFVRQREYDPAAVKGAMEKALAPLGGMEAFVRPGQRVILKPNLVLGFSPEKAATTHPAVVRAVAELALERGATVGVGDSPGIGSARSAGEKAGLGEVVRELGLAWVEFTPAPVTDARRTFQTLRLARELLDADVVINLPKMKTHCQMGMTLAVKNCFGAVVGLEKFQWHYRAGVDKETFGRMLYEIARALAPAVSILDAVVAMDGDGPTRGRPNPTGFLAAATDPCALDAAILDLLALPRETLWTLRAARAAGDRDWESVRIAGEPLDDLRPAHWTLPAPLGLSMHGPRFLPHVPAVSRWIRKQVTPLPVPAATCIRCGECVRICPARAMKMTEEGVRIEEARCIRCYCCHELCPHGAMDLRLGRLARLARRWFVRGGGDSSA